MIRRRMSSVRLIIWSRSCVLGSNEAEYGAPETLSDFLETLSRSACRFAVLRCVRVLGLKSLGEVGTLFICN